MEDAPIYRMTSLANTDTIGYGLLFKFVCSELEQLNKKMELFFFLIDVIQSWKDNKSIQFMIYEQKFKFTDNIYNIWIDLLDKLVQDDNRESIYEMEHFLEIEVMSHKSKLDEYLKTSELLQQKLQEVEAYKPREIEPKFQEMDTPHSCSFCNSPMTDKSQQLCCKTYCPLMMDI